MIGPRRARSLELLDRIDAFTRSSFEGTVWRVCHAGRDPILGSSSNSRWCNRDFDVLYTSMDRDGAAAEIYAYLSLQPVFPLKMTFHAHRITLRAAKLLDLSDLAALAQLGVDVARYRDRTYERTQEIADAAYFLDFGGLIAPSARWPCRNVVVFTDRLDPASVEIVENEAEPIDWRVWKRRLQSQRS